MPLRSRLRKRRPKRDEPYPGITPLADEGVDRQIVERLRADGHSVLYVAEMDPGLDDDQILLLANEHSAALLTQDKDFGELVFRQRLVHQGVILVRLLDLTPPLKAVLVSQAFERHASAMSGMFTVVSPGRVRIRMPFETGGPSNGHNPRL